MINIIRNKRIILGIFVLCITHVYAQNKLSYLDFLRQVKQYHPLALKANLTREQGSLFVKQARGIYDPILTSKYKEKDYNSKNYYTMFDTDVKWKTITGIQLMGGFGNDQGVYLNPENTTPSGGLGYLGASIPLGKGLFFDENRLLLKGAQQIQNQLNADSEAQFNDLFFKSSESRNDDAV